MLAFRDFTWLQPIFRRQLPLAIEPGLTMVMLFCKRKAALGSQEKWPKFLRLWLLRSPAWPVASPASCVESLFKPMKSSAPHVEQATKMQNRYKAIVETSILTMMPFLSAPTLLLSFGTWKLFQRMSGTLVWWWQAPRSQQPFRSSFPVLAVAGL